MKTKISISLQRKISLRLIKITNPLLSILRLPIDNYGIAVRYQAHKDLITTLQLKLGETVSTWSSIKSWKMILKR
jgi:hypothetical protein